MGNQPYFIKTNVKNITQVSCHIGNGTIKADIVWKLQKVFTYVLSYILIQSCLKAAYMLQDYMYEREDITTKS